ncbi:hypothetical protein E3Q16_04013 [Wallemia mellicola]|nr:hypothetical protein E3Q16_04013 [Wallemia mellicola]TIC12806.1 hypothetical protein E3Q13_04076 [Wallemia mellicola]
MESDPLGQNRPFRHQIDSLVYIHLSVQLSDSQTVTRKMRICMVYILFKHAIEASVHYKPLIVAIGEVGRNLINRMSLEEVSNELVADKQIIALLLSLSENDANVLYIPSQPVLELTQQVSRTILDALKPSTVVIIDGYPNTTIYLPESDSENPPLLQLANVNEEKVTNVGILPAPNIVEGLSAALLSSGLFTEKVTTIVGFLVPTLAPYTPVVSQRLVNSLTITARSKSEDLDDFIEGETLFNQLSESIQQKMSVRFNKVVQSKIDLVYPFRRRRNVDNLMYL